MKFIFNQKSALVLAVLLLASIFPFASGIGAALPEPASPGATSKIYLPFVTTGSSTSGVPVRPLGIFGVETSYIDSALLSKADGIDTSWWRYFAFSWKAIEPNDVSPSSYNWSPGAERQLRDAAEGGFTLVATVKYTPYWAQAINDSQSIQCSPIKEDTATMADFYEFVTALVNRYKGPPYNIKYWQFWTRPATPGTRPSRSSDRA